MANRRAKIRNTEKSDISSDCNDSNFNLSDKSPSTLTSNTTRNNKEKKNKKAKGVRPSWSLTQDEFETKEEKEVEDILSFTNNLDFDTYVEQVEVQETLKGIDEQIAVLENYVEEEEEEGGEKEREEEDGEREEVHEGCECDHHHASQPQQTSVPSKSLSRPSTSISLKPAQHTQGWNTSTKVDEVGQVVEKALSSAPPIRAIHSSRSLRQVASTALSSSLPSTSRSGISCVKPMPDIEEEAEIVIPKPTIVVATNEKKGMSEGFLDRVARDMPFMYRTY